MKLSKYNVHFSVGEKDYVFNTRHRALAKLDCPGALLKEENRLQAKKQGFLVEDARDETSDLIREVYQKINSPLKTLDLTLVLTEACNFQCVYCYQGEKAHKVYSQQDEDKLFAFILEAQKQGLEEVHIHYFGGEPLLNLSRLKSLHQRFKKVEKETGLKYLSHITTNGSMLTTEILKTLSVNGIQLTFDGSEKWHNRYKVSSTFDYHDLLRCVDDVLAYTKARLRLRMNFSEENAQSFQQMLEDIFLCPHFDKRRVEFSLHPLLRCDAQMPFTQLEPEKFAEYWTFYRRSLEARGILFDLPPSVAQPCPFSVGRALVIKPGYTTCSCLTDYQLSESLDALPQRIARAELSYQPEEVCYDCVVFPLCLGGCRVKQPGKGGCIVWKYALKDFLCDYVQRGV